MKKTTRDFLGGFMVGMLIILIVCIAFRNQSTYHYSGDEEWEPTTIHTYVDEPAFKVYYIQPDQSSIRCYFAGSDTTSFKTCTNRN